MVIFILVHGVWHRGGCWQKVLQQLEAARHVVETPTLPGMGETALLEAHNSQKYEDIS